MPALLKRIILIFMLVTTRGGAMAQPTKAHFQSVQFIAFDEVTCHYVGKDGTLWLGHFSGGVSAVDPEMSTYTRYRHSANDPNTLLDDNVTSILEDKYGHIWVNTGEGLNCIRQEAGNKDVTIDQYPYDDQDAHSLHHAFSRDAWDREDDARVIGLWPWWAWTYPLFVFLIAGGLFLIYRLQMGRTPDQFDVSHPRASNTVKSEWEKPMENSQKRLLNDRQAAGLPAKMPPIIYLLVQDGQQADFVTKARAAVEAHLDDPTFDVHKLCRVLAMSHSQVHRKLTALTGVSATYFIRYVRLNKARELLQYSGFSINAVAFDSGFSDTAYFCRVFKHEFGVTPLTWREQINM